MTKSVSIIAFQIVSVLPLGCLTRGLGSEGIVRYDLLSGRPRVTCPFIARKGQTTKRGNKPDKELPYSRTPYGYVLLQNAVSTKAILDYYKRVPFFPRTTPKSLHVGKWDLLCLRIDRGSGAPVEDLLIYLQEDSKWTLVYKRHATSNENLPYKFKVTDGSKVDIVATVTKLQANKVAKTEEKIVDTLDVNSVANNHSPTYP